MRRPYILLQNVDRNGDRLPVSNRKVANGVTTMPMLSRLASLRRNQFNNDLKERELTEHPAHTVDSARRGGLCLTDRVRQRGEPIARARDVSAKRRPPCRVATGSGSDRGMPRSGPTRNKRRSDVGAAVRLVVVGDRTKTLETLCSVPYPVLRSLRVPGRIPSADRAEPT